MVPPKTKIDHIAIRPGAMRPHEKAPISASFPPTVLAVSGSRVRTTKSTLSRMHPAPRRRIRARSVIIIAHLRPMSRVPWCHKLSFSGVSRNPSPGEKVAREAGRKWNAGRKVGYGTQKQTFEDVRLQQAFARTAHCRFARIPLPPPVCALGAPSPRERGYERFRASAFIVS